MSQQKYRLNLSFPSLYKEVELFDNAPQAKVIGTTRECNVRLARENFFRDFELAFFSRGDGRWDVLCSGSCYISQDGILKLHRLTLDHGDSFVVCYQDGGADLCHGEFLRDFDAVGNQYSRYISLSNQASLCVGATSNCQILLNDPAIGSGFMELHAVQDHWMLTDHGTRYGVSVNGERITAPREVFDYDFFSVSGHAFYLRGARLYFCEDDLMQCRGLPVYEHRDSATQMKYPYLNRSTRIRYALPEEKLQIQNPPARREPPRRNLLMNLLPTLAMLLVVVLLRGAMGGGGAFILFSACSMSIGLITSVVSYRQEKKQTRQAEEERVRGYTAYVQKKEAQIVQEREQEARLLEENTPCIERTLQSVWLFDQRLYERTPQDEDFLSVRLGSGPRASVCPIKINPTDYKTVDDPLTDWPEQLEAKYRLLPDAPILLALKDLSSVGILGTSHELYEIAKLMTVDLCVRHAYFDLRLCYFLSPQQAKEWSWVRWLRHVTNPLTGMRSIACDADSYKLLCESLYKELSDRENMAQSRGANFLPHYVVFVFDFYQLGKHPLSRFFVKSADLGVSFVFCSSAAEFLPKCQRLVWLSPEGAKTFDADRGDRVETFAPACVSDENASRAALKLASVTVDEVNLAVGLTRNMTLYRLLNIFGAYDLDTEELWKTSEVYKSMSAPLGINAKGETVCLDLHEKAHGPHGLVAGTTGSGKSELLQTYVLSMAVRFHPYDVGFVIIDFKGGGMANQFRDLPHLMGSITDIDGREINRSLLSIRAELTRRKTLFASAEVNHIDQYTKKYKSGQLTVPLPHLILIVDEFAELKAEQPEFMKELISTARVGRSLGVHLILATQKPAGVVDAQIWSNSRFRLCLKVATSEDSKEMIKTPLAAEIREPGRAYLQVGNNEIFELFQSAYSGAGSDSEITTGQRVYRIDQLDLSGVRRPLYRSMVKNFHQSEQTQLQEMISMFCGHCRRHNIPRLNGICLPPLEAVYDLPAELPKTRKPGHTVLELGILDDPEYQRQAPVKVELTGQNVMIVGAAQYGKTNILQSILRQLAQRCPPSELWVYILDFASLSLGAFERLPHVGGVVRPDEDEKLHNLFKLLREEMERRKKVLAESGLSSFGVYQEAGGKELSQILVMIDNFTALRELYLQDDDFLHSVLRDGGSLGISVVMTVTQTTGVGYKYLSNFPCKLALHCNEASEYSTLFGYNKTQPKKIPGRFLLEQDKRLLEAQAYLAFPGEKEADRVQAVARFLDEQTEQWKHQRARRIPVIPDVLTMSFLVREYPEMLSMPYHVPLGLDFETVQAMSVDLYTVGVLAVCGDEQSGRTQWMRLALNWLAKRTDHAPVRFYVVDDVRRSCGAFADSPATAAYSVLATDAKTMLAEMHTEGERRYAALLKAHTQQKQETLEVLILQNREAIADIAADPKAMAAYKEVTTKFRGMGLCVLMTNVENFSITYAAPEPYRMLKEHRSFLMFEDVGNIKLFDVPIAEVRKFKRKLEPAEAFYACGNELRKIRTPLP